MRRVCVSLWDSSEHISSSVNIWCISAVLRVEVLYLFPVSAGATDPSAGTPRLYRSGSAFPPAQSWSLEYERSLRWGSRRPSTPHRWCHHRLWNNRWKSVWSHSTISDLHTVLETIINILMHIQSTWYSTISHWCLLARLTNLTTLKCIFVCIILMIVHAGWN